MWANDSSTFAQQRPSAFCCAGIYIRLPGTAADNVVFVEDKFQS